MTAPVTAAPSEPVAYAIYENNGFREYLHSLYTTMPTAERLCSQMVWPAKIVPLYTAASIESIQQDARALRDALEQLLGPEDDPNIGWRGLAKLDPHENFACECCGVEGLDCAKLAHLPTCQILAARTALGRSE